MDCVEQNWRSHHHRLRKSNRRQQHSRRAIANPRGEGRSTRLGLAALSDQTSAFDRCSRKSEKLSSARSVILISLLSSPRTDASWSSECEQKGESLTKLPSTLTDLISFSVLRLITSYCHLVLSVKFKSLLSLPPTVFSRERIQENRFRLAPSFRDQLATTSEGGRSGSSRLETKNR